MTKSLVPYSSVDPDEMLLFTTFTLTKWTVRLPDDVEASNLSPTAYRAEPALAAFPMKLHSSMLTTNATDDEIAFSMCKALYK